MPLDKFVKLKDQTGFKRLMNLAVAIVTVPLWIMFLLAIGMGTKQDRESLDGVTLLLILFVPLGLGLTVYGTFRIIYWLVDGFRQGTK